MDVKTMVGIAGGGAAIGMLAGFWAQVQSFFTQLKAFFIVTYVLEYDIFEATLAYLHKEFKGLPMATYMISGAYLFYKPRRRRSLVAYKSGLAGGGARLFRKGWRFLSASNSPKETARISFIRGTFDVDALMKEVLDWTNETELIAGQTRFFVRDVFGSLEFPDFGNQRQGGSPDTPPAAPAEAPGGSFDFQRKLQAGLYTIVGYNKNDVQLTTGYDQNYMKYLVFPQSVLDAIEEIRIWIDAKEWYRQRGIGWKRGWLLHGKPGCGKSALVRALGEKHDLPIYAFHLITMTNTDLVSEWQRMTKNTPCIALIEDIDAVFDGRTNLNKNTFQSVLSFDTLLNCLDGIGRGDGVLTIVTTNNLDKLDAALGIPREGPEKNGSIMSTRPGRIDRALEMVALNDDCRRRLAEIILKGHPDLQEQVIAVSAGDTGAQFSERCIRLALAGFWTGSNTLDKNL